MNLPRRKTNLLLSVLAALALIVDVSAQGAPQDVDTVLDNIANAAKELQDASFLLTGKLIDADGTEIALEIEMLLAPQERVASAYIIQPDALADNQIVLDGEAVYSYTFLTNQVTIFDADDPDALGGMLPSADDGATANISFDLGKIFEGYEASILEVTEGESGPVYHLNFNSLDDAAQILDVQATVPASDWLPRRLVFLDDAGDLVAELNAEDLVTDQGLDLEEIRALPEDAEIIDNRN